MTDKLQVTCGQCQKVMLVPEVLAGKRIKCGGCSNTILVPKAAPAKAAAATAETASKADNQPLEIFKEATAYGIEKLDDQLRCAFCAADMEEGQVICLKCGYNMQTRERHGIKVLHPHSGLDYFLWHLPAVLCILVLLFCIFGIVVVWTDFLNLGDFFTEYVQKWKWGAVYSTAFLLFIMYLTGRFGFKRLIYHPHPPEVEKHAHEGEHDDD